MVSTVTDRVEEVCVDPGETVREPSWKPGKLDDPARQEGEKTGSWYRTVEEDRHHKMPQKLGGGLATTPSHVYAQSMYHCALYINY